MDEGEDCEREVRLDLCGVISEGQGALCVAIDTIVCREVRGWQKGG